MIHTVLLASLGVYAIISFSLAHRLSAPPPGLPRGQYLWAILALLGAAQFAFASWFGKSILRSRGSVAGVRIRRYFLIRGSSAEAIGLYGLLGSNLGVSPLGVGALLAVSAAGLLASFPTRSAWERALRMTESPEP